MKRMTWIAAAAVLLVVAGCWGWSHVMRSDYRKALPASATDINEKSVDMFPDWTLFLKAKMPLNDYAAYIKKIGLGLPLATQTNSPWTKWADGHCWGAAPPTWWNPTPLNLGTVGASSGHAITMAKYENGYLYLVDWKY